MAHYQTIRRVLPMALLQSQAWKLKSARKSQCVTPAMMRRLRSYGSLESVEPGGHLFQQGERLVDFFVVEQGELELYERKGRASCEVDTTLAKLQFTGELDLLNDRPSLLNCRAVRRSRVLRIPRESIRTLMRTELDIAELILTEWILRRARLGNHRQGGIIVVGDSLAAETMRIERFLIGNGHPHQLIDSNLNLEAEVLLRALDVESDQLPVVFFSDGTTLRKPANTGLANKLGFDQDLEHKDYDLAVVGGGPAGLAAAVYGASEGLTTVVIEGTAPGGQAGTSSKIENYLGFPTGVSGQRLASRAQLQALKFGVRFAISREVVTAEQINGIHKLTLAGGISVCTRSVVVATGAQYRKLSVENYSQFENHGIYYAATAMESLLCRDNEVIVVGGGNSAGQAAVFLSGIAKHVHHIVRGKSLAATMSQYLISRIENSSRITLYTDSEIVTLEGGSSLRGVTWVDRRTGDLTVKPIGSV